MEEEQREIEEDVGRGEKELSGYASQLLKGNVVFPASPMQGIRVVST